MITTRNKPVLAILFAAIILTLSLGGCKKDTPPASTTYQLKAKDQLGVSGTVTFTQTSGTVTTIVITITGADSQTHPAQILAGAAIEGGLTSITLNPVSAGTSTTQVTKLDNGTAIDYSQLIVYDGFLNVYESSTDMITVVAQGDIGGNAFTGTNKSYTLSAISPYTASGTALLEKRNNGNTLVTISLGTTGLISGQIYPAGIYIGSVANVGGGPLAKTLTPVDGASGKSYTNVRALDNTTVITYDNWLAYDGFLAISLSPTQLTTFICDGNIGTH